MAAVVLVSVGAGNPSPLPAASAVATAYPTGVRDVVVEVGDRSFGARIDYPSSSADGGTDAPLAVGRFPAIVFGHGYLSTVERYESTLRDLASRGFLVVAPRSGDGLLAQPRRVRAGLLDRSRLAGVRRTSAPEPG